MILDGFPNSDELTNMKKNELDNIIAELEKYIAMLIALRCADIEILVFCVFGKFRIKRLKTKLTWECFKKSLPEKSSGENDSDSESDGEEPQNDFSNMSLKKADDELVNKITGILNQVDNAWGKSVEILYIFGEIKKSFTKLGYAVEVSSRKLEISWASTAYNKLKDVK